MLYLIQDRDYLKIGYSSNMDQRKKAYETTNCYAEVIMTKDGSRKDETILHNLCKPWQYKNEWFYYDEQVIEIFKEYQPNQEQKVKELEESIVDIKNQISKIQENINVLTAFIHSHEETLNNWYSEYKKLEKSTNNLKNSEAFVKLMSTLNK